MLYMLLVLLSSSLSLWLGIRFGSQRVADRVFEASDTVIKRQGQNLTTCSKAYQYLFREMHGTLERKGPK